MQRGPTPTEQRHTILTDDLQSNYAGLYETRTGFGQHTAVISIDFIDFYTVPSAPFFGQGVVDAVIANIPLYEAARRASVPVVGTTVTATTIIGWMLMRFGVLPGTTGAWGTLPGAAPAMTALADQHGGDARMVAIMQYLRVAGVVGSGSLVAHALASIFMSADPGTATTLQRFVPDQPASHSTIATGVTLAIAVLGSYADRRSRLAAGPFVMPMLLGAAA